MRRPATRRAFLHRASKGVGRCQLADYTVTARRILRVLADCPDELAELRATLLQEHGLAQTRGPRLARLPTVTQ